MSGGVVSTPSGQSSGTVMSPSGPSGGSIISPIDQGSVASGGVTSPPRAPGVVAPPPRAASLTRDEVAAFFPSIYGVSRRDVEQVLSSQFGIRDPVVGRLKAKGPQDPSVAQFLSASIYSLIFSRVEEATLDRVRLTLSLYYGNQSLARADSFTAELIEKEG
eukprot:GHVN01072405.1.p1 GENE.GHVN01072405.1~~GHVN01072405.1.p1  ORF type:complete len:162 (+),score=25.59 GHVN01072405.1:1092-1577(+)